MDRRRALMGKSGDEEKILYSLENSTVSEGTCLNTQVKLFDKKQSFTILVNFQNTTNPSTSGATASAWMLVGCYDTPNSRWSFAVYKVAYNKSNMKLCAMEQKSAGTSISGSNPSVGTHRYALTYDHTTQVITVKNRKGTGTIYTTTRSCPYT